MTFNPSSYENPETRPFGGFYNDMTIEQIRFQRQTFRELRSHEYGHYVANQLGEVLGNILYNGGIFQATKEMSTTWSNGYHTPSFNDSIPTLYCPGRLGVWYDTEKRLFNVLEWNKVKGVVTRSYAPMTFIKKLYKTYVFNGRNYPEVTPESFQPVIDILFPDWSKMEVQVWDTPSKMYEYDNIDSCMVGEEYVKFYDTAPCKGLVVMLGDKLVTRCILWTLDNGQRIIGRIYDSTGGGSTLLKKWCKENGVIVDGWDDDSYIVTCPVSKYGVPYQDNFWYGVRQQDNLVLFNDATTANEYMHKNKVYGKKVYDMCSTDGNVAALRGRLVECHDKSFAVESDTILQEGVYYNTHTLRSPTAYNLARTPLDEMVYHPELEDVVIAAGLLDVLDGQVVVRSECITLEDGRLAHPSQLRYRLTVVNDELAVDNTPVKVVELKGSYIELDKHNWPRLMQDLAANLGFPLNNILYVTSSDWSAVRTKIYGW